MVHRKEKIRKWKIWSRKANFHQVEIPEKDTKENESERISLKKKRHRKFFCEFEKIHTRLQDFEILEL